MVDAGIDLESIGEVAGLKSSVSNVAPDGSKRAPLSDSNGLHLYQKSIFDHIEEGTLHITWNKIPDWTSERPMLPYQRVFERIKGNQQALEALKNTTLPQVHVSGRVYAGDGHKPEVDCLFQTAMDRDPRPAGAAPSGLPLQSP